MSRPEGPIKYRASCDGCYLAKLKCSKEKPTCPRCKNLGLTCTYSPSQRTGKHRATKSQASSSCSTTTATTLAATTTTPSATSPAQVLAWQPAVSSSVPASAILPTETLTNPFDKHPFPPKNDPSLTLMDTPMSDWSGSATTMPDLDSNLLAPWRNYLPNADQDDFQFDILDDFPSMIPPVPDQKQPLGAPPPLPTPPPSSDTSSSCNCFASITQALHELHAQSRRSNRIPALEATLSGSKKVTARGEQLLRCSGGVCASDGSLIMLFAALLSKYLSLYAANTTDLIVSSSSSSSSSSTSSSSSSTSPPSPSSSSCCADVFPSRVTIGTYTMDVEDGERLRMEIVLMELQKLNALLGKFRGKVSCSSSSASSCVGVDVAAYEYEGHTYETVLDFLNTRLKEAMNRLQRQKQRFQAPGA